MDQKKIEKYTATNILRIIISIIYTGVFYFMEGNKIILVMFSFHLVFSILWLIITEFEIFIESNHWYSPYLPVNLDIIGNFTILTGTGNIHSYFTIVFFVITSLSSLGTNTKLSKYSAFTSSLSFTVCGLLVYLNILPNINIFSKVNAEVNVSNLLLSSIYVFLGLVVVSSIISSTIQKLNDSILKEENSKRELKESQEALSRAEREGTMNQMVAHLAHEVNNPLNYISTGEIVARDGYESTREFAFGAIPDSEETKPFRNELGKRFAQIEDGLNQSKNGIKRIADTIAEIRAITRLDGLQVDNFDLGQVFQENLNLTLEKNQVDRSPIFLSIQGEPYTSYTFPSLSILSQRYILGRAFRSILSESIFFARKNPKNPRVEIEIQKTEETTKEGNLVLITFRNNGPSIEEGEEIKIFDLKSKKTRGVELIGLPIIKELLKSIECNISLVDNGRKSGWVEFQVIVKDYVGKMV
jgi:signal transduction histidine kinase